MPVCNTVRTASFLSAVGFSIAKYRAGPDGLISSRWYLATRAFMISNDRDLRSARHSRRARKYLRRVGDRAVPFRPAMFWVINSLAGRGERQLGRRPRTDFGVCIEQPIGSRKYPLVFLKYPTSTGPASPCGQDRYGRPHGRQGRAVHRAQEPRLLMHADSPTFLVEEFVEICIRAVEIFVENLVDDNAGRRQIEGGGAPSGRPMLAAPLGRKTQ